MDSVSQFSVPKPVSERLGAPGPGSSGESSAAEQRTTGRTNNNNHSSRISGTATERPKQVKTIKLTTLGAALAIFMLSIPAARAGQKGNPNPGILPPNAVFKGKTAGEWTAAWWYWVGTTPNNAQMFDDTGAHAYDNNNGADGLFFLAKSWAGVPQTRKVTVPAGTALLVPVMGLGLFGSVELWATTDEWLPGFGIPANPTPQQVIDWMNSHIPDMKNLSVIIDGQPVAGLEDGNLHYLNNTGLVSLYNPDGSVYAELGYGFEISLILTPLRPGKHVIKMSGDGALGFHTDVTYLLTVE